VGPTGDGSSTPVAGHLLRRARFRPIDRPRGSSWDPADLKALLDHLGVDKADVLTTSSGGRVLLRFAKAFPDRALSLILQGNVPPDGFPLPYDGPDRFFMAEWQSPAKQKGLDASAKFGLHTFSWRFRLIARRTGRVSRTSCRRIAGSIC
jgi:pimeloyl-ACP methyl ester carboxylesterase